MNSLFSINPLPIQFLSTMIPLHVAEKGKDHHMPRIASMYVFYTALFKRSFLRGKPDIT